MSHASEGLQSHACAQDWLRNTEAVEEVQIMGEIPQQLRKSIALQVTMFLRHHHRPWTYMLPDMKGCSTLVISWPHNAAGLSPARQLLQSGALGGRLTLQTLHHAKDHCIS